MPSHDAFLAEILANPKDDTPRLIFADWLEGRGDTDRADFIRCQCELARVCNEAVCRQTCAPPDFEGCPQRGLRRRESDLLREHGHLWANPVAAALLCYDWEYDGGFRGDAGRSWGWRRGFVAEVSLPCADWLAHGPALVRAAPLERVTLADVHTEQLRRDSNTFWPAHEFWWNGDNGVMRRPGWCHFHFIPRGTFSNEATALDALSDACLEWAKAAPLAATEIG